MLMWTITCSCESSGCHRDERKARLLPQPGSCCPAGWPPDTWPQPADHKTLWGQWAPRSVYYSPAGHTVCSEREGISNDKLCQKQGLRVSSAAVTWWCRLPRRSRRCWATWAPWQYVWLCWCGRKTYGWSPSRSHRAHGPLCRPHQLSISCLQNEEGTVGTDKNQQSWRWCTSTCSKKFLRAQKEKHKRNEHFYLFSCFVLGVYTFRI